MKILWITNIMMPDICIDLGFKTPSMGGWMYSSLEYLKTQDNLIIAVAAPYNGNQFVQKEINGILYYLLPLNGRDKTKYHKLLEPYFLDIKNTFHPDIVHIHGSEFPFGLAYLKSCGNKGLVVSIQGLISIISRYYLLDRDDSCHITTFRDLLRGGLKHTQKGFEKRGQLEIELLKHVNYIIGRTKWDQTHSWAINQNAKYFFVGETLRPSFYKSKWEYDKCKPHSIFISQAGYPIKGFHKLLKALPLVLKYYPDTIVNVAGDDPTLKPWYRIDSYGKYIKQLIKQLRLDQHVHFMGQLKEEEMCNQYLGSNVFICCSAIENSPNSLGEAQTLGMPYLASFVGGIPEIVSMHKDALYRYDEYEILAHKIINIFNLGKDFQPFPYDRSRYQPDYNKGCLLKAYQTIFENNTNRVCQFSKTKSC